jgi:hypothetical protein
MAKAALTLPNGTVVQIEGTTEEVRALLDVYGTGAASAQRPVAAVATAVARGRRRSKKPQLAAQPTAEDATGGAAPNLAEIVNSVKTCEEAENIEKQILERVSQVDRTLLPLYMVHEHFGNRVGLTSGEINKITADLGVPVSQPNASRTLSSTAQKYVIGDVVRVKGQTVRYKLHRRGVNYLKAVIAGKADENAE